MMFHISGFMDAVAVVGNAIFDISRFADAVVVVGTANLDNS